MNPIERKTDRKKLKEETFMEMAALVSSLSTCCRKKIGAVLVKDERIISTGYNGTPPGMEHCIDKFNVNGEEPKTILDANFFDLHGKWSKENELHAEQNCIAFAARNGVQTDGCAMFVTTSPCCDCAKLIAAAGITRVVYLEEYDRDPSGIKTLKRAGVAVEKQDAK